MGIPGLWSELDPAAQATTLPSYCLESFTKNKNELRSLTLGIDASIWLFHAQQSTGGSNPYTRTLFYRLAKLLALPVLPLFVLDGPNRPSWKRGKQVLGRQHAIERSFCELIDAFGFLWRRAEGEAEAELAHLNQTGAIDAVLTDDSDTLLFGAHTLIRNWGKNLSGTRSFHRTDSAATDVFGASGEVDRDGTDAMVHKELKLSGSDKDHLITIYSADALRNHPDVGLDKDGLILVALLAGGDYDSVGLFQCGIKIAIGLARCGFGSKLVEAFKSSYASQSASSRECPRFRRFVLSWLEEIRAELRSNEQGKLTSRRPQLASSLSDLFLSTERSRHVLACYVYPLTSANSASSSSSNEQLVWPSLPNLTRLAHISQFFFRWSRATLLARFRSTVWPGIVSRKLRQEALEINGDAEEGPWGALVESPASKAVRRYMEDRHKASATQDQDRATSPISSGRAQEKTIHSSPKSARITDFFARNSSTARADAGLGGTADAIRRCAQSLNVVSITMQRRHAALAPFLDYRCQVEVIDWFHAANRGIDEKLEAEIEAACSTTLAEGSDPSDAVDSASCEEGDTEGREIVSEMPASSTKAAKTSPRAKPEDPLLLWVPEPLLRHSVSANAILSAFLAKLEEKEKKKAASIGSRSRKQAAGRGQQSLTMFMKPVAKASLIQAPSKVRSPRKASRSQPADIGPTVTSAHQGPITIGSDPSEPDSSVSVPVPRTPARLVIPESMQRPLARTESFPSKSVPSKSVQSRSLSRYTSLPSPAVLEKIDATKNIEVGSGGISEEDELDSNEDLDSSIEFLGARASGGADARSRAKPGSGTVGILPASKNALATRIHTSLTSTSSSTTQPQPSARSLKKIRSAPAASSKSTTFTGQTRKARQGSVLQHGKTLAPTPPAPKEKDNVLAMFFDSDLESEDENIPAPTLSSSPHRPHKPTKPRVSTITISSSSETED
ncbi:hypothetical protein BCV70DRAFT_201081 [Testicularia cyperi]|uniref:XPG-I domain-containing protein n=1 Tax=Testicularia cyperi TaxID=1882483 RepID=A0A317XMH4_9BASI|nr:hypothetical protein BCV70DRAFT_201081 [Testicularia cyperi]